MKTQIFLLLTFSLLTSCKPQIEVDTTKGVILSSIVGGIPVDPTQTETRYIVKIGDGCAGSIIASQWIITAAHCESQFDQNISAGSKELGVKKRYLYRSHKSFIHTSHKYFKNGSTHDVALLKLKKPINFDETGLIAIKLADMNFENNGGLDIGVMVTALGWGDTREGGRPSNKLLKVEVPIADKSAANTKKFYDGKLDNSMLVAGYPAGGKDSCNGDSGGPLTVTDSDGQTLLAGIVSFGDECARAGFPGVYAKIPYFYEWIQKTMREN